MSETSYMEQELQSQPETWRKAARIGAAVGALPAAGQRVAVVGCGTSWFMAQSYAALREGAGLGVTDPFAASKRSSAATGATTRWWRSPARAPRPRCCACSTRSRDASRR